MSKCPVSSKVSQNDKERLFSKDSNFWAVMNTVLDGLIIIDSQGAIQTFNPSAVRIFGFQPEEVIGQNIRMLMPEPYCSGHDSYLQNYITTKNAKVIGIGREVSGRRKNGEIFAMELGVNELWLDGNMMFVGTVRDISDRTNAEKEMQSYIAALKHSNQELDDFAYIASHDLKEPLRGLSNNALFLKEDYEKVLDMEGINRIGRMIYLCERMEQLINDLLYFARIGNQELAIKKVDLNDVVMDILSMMETSLSEGHVKVLLPKQLPSITCDGLRITEVFRNLITNAIKYNNKSEKIVEIGFQQLSPNDVDDNANEYIFYVKDNGIGISKEYHHDIFRIFKRLNDEDDSVKGTGVGLTFVKKIIERHGGSIWVESELGVGTTFYFNIQGHSEV